MAVAARTADEQVPADGADVPCAGASVSRLEMPHQFLAMVMNRFRRGVLIVDGDLQVLYANDPAKEILGRGDAVVIEAGRFVLRLGQVARRLEAYLAAVQAGQFEPTDLALRVQRSTGERDYRMWVSPLAFDDGWANAFLIMVFNPDTARHIKASVLTDLYGLTQAEARIAARLFQGLTVGEAATDMSISKNTARTHLRSIFRKCEVESQSQLLQLLSLGPRGD